MISDCLKIENFEIEDHVHPINFCQNCHRTLMHCKKDKNYNTSLNPKNWQPHGENCATCESLKVLKQGGRKKKKKGNRGRPTFVGEWSTTFIDQLIENKSSPPLDFSMIDFREEKFAENNPDFQRCLCGYCGNLITVPLLFVACEHGVCWECFKKNTVSQPIHKTRCPKCQIPVKQDGVKYSVLLETLLKSLKLDCPRKCSQLVNVIDLNKHLMDCKGEVLTATKILSLSTKDKLPKELHSVLGHGMKLVMSQSNSETIKIKTGGQVRPYLDLYCVYCEEE